MNALKDFLGIKNRKLNILILGADGMLGYDVYSHFKRLSALKDSIVGIVTGITVADNIDFTIRHALGSFMADKVHYDWCINCIAYTDTWKAEYDAKGKLNSYELNALAPKYIAESCNFRKTKLIHISTDYVFSELSCPGDELLKVSSDKPFPKNIYGMHKLLGEMGIAEEFDNEKNWCCLRTSWLYGAHNNKSFIHKFMKNVGRACKKAQAKTEKVHVAVTSDEFSIPTSTDCVIECIDKVIVQNRYGIAHAVSSVITVNPPSRLDFAREILKCYSEPAVPDEYANKMFNYKLSDVVLDEVSLPDNAFYPKMSAMKETFPTKSWQSYLRAFMKEHKTEILNYAIKEIENEQNSTKV